MGEALPKECLRCVFSAKRLLWCKLHPRSGIALANGQLV